MQDSLRSFTALFSVLIAAAVTVNNTAPRTTANGEIVDSHNGGLIIAFDGRYHLYGVSFGGCMFVENACQTQKRDFTARSPPARSEQPEGCSNTSAGACGFGENTTISVYSSPDLSQNSWVLERADVLPVPAGPLRGTVSRPNLVRCPLTSAWVLWWNFANVSDEGQWALAVAQAAGPLGPFELVAAPVSMPHEFIGDFTLFSDEAGDGAAWLYYTTWQAGGRLFLARLDATFTRLADPPETLGPLFGGLSLVESPLLWRRDDGGGDGSDAYYFLTGRGCCFCEEGSGAYVFTAPALTGPYTSWGNVGCDYSRPAAHVSVASQGCLLLDVCYTSILQAQVRPTASPRVSALPVFSRSLAALPKQLSYTFAIGEAPQAQRVLVFDSWQHAPDGLKGHDPELWMPVEYAPTGGLLPLRPIDVWDLHVPNATGNA